MEVVLGASMEAGNLRCRPASRYTAPSGRDTIRASSCARRGGLPLAFDLPVLPAPIRSWPFPKIGWPGGEARALEQRVNDGLIRSRAF
jgi:hypothetical protein